MDMDRTVAGRGTTGGPSSPSGVAGSAPLIAPRDTAPAEAPLPAEVTLPISAVAERTGVTPATLRMWQRRYGLGATGSSPGGHRRYSVDDLSRITAAQRLVGQGVSPAEAARAVLAVPGALPRPATPHGYPIRYPGTTSLWMVEEELALPPSADPAAHHLGAAAVNLDGPTVRMVLRDFLAHHGVVATWEAVLRPVLAVIGRRWGTVPLGVAVEHLISHTATTELDEVVARADTGPAPAVLLSCLPQEEHVLPLVVLAAALGERGDVATVLGPRAAPAALAEAAGRYGVEVVMVFALLPELTEPAVLDTLGPVARIAAGPGWNPHDLPAGVHHVDTMLDALELITALAHPVSG